MLKNMEGQKVPDVKLKTREGNNWVEITTNDIFKNKTVVVFSLPGAFTPTCSSAHVPGYNNLIETFKKNGVDEVVCISVNDPFVMNAWKKDESAENIRFIPDGNGEFTDKMGMLVNKEAIGFGKRSWRYSMLVKNSMIEKMFIEPEKEGDPFEVSDAETMLKYINPKEKAPEPVTLFTKEGCPFCAKAKAMLSERGMKYEEISLGKTITTRTLLAVTGKTSVPQVFIGGKYIGGSEDLEKFLTKEKQLA